MSDYDTDLLTWSERQAALLRRRAAGELVKESELDWSNIAEEIESLGKSDRRELRNRVATILLHLIKLQASPAMQPRAAWHDTLFEQRASLRDLLNASPSLRREIAARNRASILRRLASRRIKWSSHGCPDFNSALTVRHSIKV